MRASATALVLLVLPGIFLCGCRREDDLRLGVAAMDAPGRLHRNRFGTWLRVIERADRGRVMFADPVDAEERFKLFPAAATERIGPYRVTGGRRELSAESLARFQSVLLDPGAFEASVPTAYPGESSFHVVLDAGESSIPVMIDAKMGILLVGLAGLGSQPRFELSAAGRQAISAVFEVELK